MQVPPGSPESPHVSLPQGSAVNYRSWKLAEDTRGIDFPALSTSQKRLSLDGPEKLRLGIFLLSVNNSVPLRWMRVAPESPRRNGLGLARGRRNCCFPLMSSLFPVVWRTARVRWASHSHSGKFRLEPKARRRYSRAVEIYQATPEQLPNRMRVWTPKRHICYVRKKYDDVWVQEGTILQVNWVAFLQWTDKLLEADMLVRFGSIQIIKLMDFNNLKLKN